MQRMIVSKHEFRDLGIEKASSSTQAPNAKTKGSLRKNIACNHADLRPCRLQGLSNRIGAYAAWQEACCEAICASQEASMVRCMGGSLPPFK